MYTKFSSAEVADPVLHTPGSDTIAAAQNVCGNHEATRIGQGNHPPDALAFSSPNPRTTYNPKGSGLDQIRRYQQLPLAWTHLTVGEVAEIRKYLTDVLEHDLDQLEREACLAIECILTTGRSLATLKKLKYYPSSGDFQQSQVPEQSFGLVAEAEGLKWYLPEGNAKRACTPKKIPRLGERGRHIATVEIAASDLTVHTFKKHWRKPQLRGRLLSSSEKELGKKIQNILTNRRAREIGPPRDMANSLVTLERHLADELVHRAGGDAAAALRFTDQASYRIAPSAAYYLPGDALKRLNPDDDEFVEASATDALREFISVLRDAVERTRSYPAAHHDAFLEYSVELITFCTGARPNFSAFPSSHAVDRATGFCQLHDKASQDHSRARLVWFPPVVVSQLEYYGAYLGVISRRAGSVFEQFAGYDACEIAFADSTFPKKKLAIGDILKRSRDRHSFDLDLNIGRKWLRTHMADRCSTETLHAFLGHWSKGMEPWCYGSFFDPLAYRADLVRTVPALLDELGWISMPASLHE